MVQSQNSGMDFPPCLLEIEKLLLSQHLPLMLLPDDLIHESGLVSPLGLVLDSEGPSDGKPNIFLLRRKIQLSRSVYYVCRVTGWILGQKE